MKKLFLFLLCCSVCGSFAQGVRIKYKGRSPGNYLTAQTAVFDGSNDHMVKTSPAGWADGKLFTCSFWLKMNGGNSALQYVASTTSAGEHWFICRTAGNLIQVVGKDLGGTTVLSLTSTSTILIASGWVHVYICIDVADVAKRKIYFNGVSETLIVTTYSNTSMDLLSGNMRIGISQPSANRLNGSLAEFWLNDVYFDDPTKFLSANHPIPLGTTGETPTGTAPAFYFSLAGSGDTWATDSSGNGNTMTVTGALTADTSP